MRVYMCVGGGREGQGKKGRKEGRKQKMVST